MVGIRRISELRRSTEVVEHREGGDPSQARKSPGRTTYDPITLERGVTQDTAFEAWANLVWKLNAAQGSEVALADFRKDIVLEFYNEAGQFGVGVQYLSLLGVGMTSLCPRSKRMVVRRSRYCPSGLKTKAG